MRREGCGGGGEDGLDGADRVGQRAGPGDDVVGQRGSGFADVERLGDGSLVVGRVIFWAQSADRAGRPEGSQSINRSKEMSNSGNGSGIGQRMPSNNPVSVDSCGDVDVGACLS